MKTNKSLLQDMDHHAPTVPSALGIDPHREDELDAKIDEAINATTKKSERIEIVSLYATNINELAYCIHELASLSVLRTFQAKP